MPQRLEQLNRWLSEELGLAVCNLRPASSDASFRRYFRFDLEGETRIVMDAPPEKENIEPFIRIGRQLHAIGLNVPAILAESLEQGFLLLSDLGEVQYLARLAADTVERLYGDALQALAVLQAEGPGAEALPPYDRQLLLTEMGLFRDWFLQRHLGLSLTAAEEQMLADTFARLADSALEQPQVCVHRDYHSRNLMVSEQNPGVLDFQDAVFGPVTYDLVSLLRDCYIDWPDERVREWVQGYHDLALEKGILSQPQGERFQRWFDLMGVQRHLKAIGIFARLNHRDGKPGYLGDIPRTLGYVRAVCDNYAELAPLGRFIAERVVPALQHRETA